MTKVIFELEELIKLANDLTNNFSSGGDHGMFEFGTPKEVKRSEREYGCEPMKLGELAFYYQGNKTSYIIGKLEEC